MLVDLPYLTYLKTSEICCSYPTFIVMQSIALLRPENLNLFF